LFGDDFGDADDPGHERHNRRHQRLEPLLWQVAERALRLGADVVLDFGCWTRQERDDFRARAHRHGADCRIHFADAPADVLLQRLAAQNAERPKGTFRIADSELKEWIGLFERPTRDELESR
jgi:predicted kinase